LHDAKATIANQLGSLEEVTRLAAQEAEQANRLATTFTKLRNYVYSKRLFHRNGLTVRLGLTDVLLSLYASAAARHAPQAYADLPILWPPLLPPSRRELFATLARFFMGDTTPAAHRKIRELRLCEHTPAPPLEELEASGPSLLPGDAVSVPPADDSAARGVYAPSEVLEQAVAAGTYGIAASAMPGARILGIPSPRPSAEPVYRLDPTLTAVKDRAEWSDRDRVLAVIDSLTERLTVLERAITELDQANLVMGDPIPAPPEMRKEGKTGMAPFIRVDANKVAKTTYTLWHLWVDSAAPGMVVPIAKLQATLERRGNEKLLVQWRELHAALSAAQREREQLRELLQMAWPSRSSPQASASPTTPTPSTPQPQPPTK